MKRLTIQQLFTKSVKGLAKQGFKQSKILNSSCVYRLGRGNNKIGCAIGVIVPPSLPIPPGHNNDPVRQLPESFLAKLGVDKNNDAAMDFLGELQSAHDSYQSCYPDMMKQKLIALGKQHGLVLPTCLSTPL